MRKGREKGAMVESGLRGPALLPFRSGGAGPDGDVRAALVGGNGGLLAGALGFGVLVNLLMLTGPLFMLQVYDRVLASRSEATLAALFALVAGLYGLMAVLDHARGRLMARLGARFQARMDGPVFAAGLACCARVPDHPAAAQAQEDVETVQRFMASPLVPALQDAPWTPLFIALIFAFHVQLGLLALAGAGVLLGLAWTNQLWLRRPLGGASAAGAAARRLGLVAAQQGDAVQALGLGTRLGGHWQAARGGALAMAMTGSDRAGLIGAVTRSFRLFLQSAILALGAWLVLQDQITPGVMIAASILLGRALAPVEQTVMQWPTVRGALIAARRLADFLRAEPLPAPVMDLPRPRALLRASNAVIAPPGGAVPVLRRLDFTLRPGRALGVIGPVGAGKSSMARALTGLWPAASGSITLDGVPLAQFSPQARAGLIGYVPQQATLFDGTVAWNIARLDGGADPAAVVQAARRACVHDLILSLPQGYQTPVGPDGGWLSGGQRQAIALARAFYGDPVALVLDEPNAHLDAAGVEALNQALRGAKQAGMAVVIMAHLPAAIQECDDLLVLEGGVQTAFGPRDTVLRERVRNHNDVLQAASAGRARAVP